MEAHRPTDRFDVHASVVSAEIHRHRDVGQAATGEDFEPGAVGEDDERLPAVAKRCRGTMTVDDDLLRLRLPDHIHAADTKRHVVAAFGCKLGPDLDKLCRDASQGIGGGRLEDLECDPL